MPSRSIGIAPTDLRNQPKGAKAEKRAAGDVVHLPPAADADQRRVEVALMIRHHQHAPGRRNVFLAREANAIDEHRHKFQQVYATVDTRND